MNLCFVLQSSIDLLSPINRGYFILSSAQWPESRNKTYLNFIFSGINVGANGVNRFVKGEQRSILSFIQGNV